MESDLSPKVLNLKNQIDSLVAVIWYAINEYPSSPASEYLYEKMMNLSPAVKHNQTDKNNMATKKTQSETKAQEVSKKPQSTLEKVVDCLEQFKEKHNGLCNACEELSEKHNNLVDFILLFRKVSYIALGVSVINTILIIVLFANK